MTTEIAIMNKSAVALAADSAVTITLAGPEGNSHKVLNSANKLFALSKCAPVGLMVYGNASLLGIPWETIVKMYREQLGDAEFPSLTDYCQDFFAFLDRFPVPLEAEQQYVLDGAVGLFHSMKRKLDGWVQQEIDSGGQLTDKQVEGQFRKLIKNAHNEFLAIGDQSVHSKSKRTKLRSKYRSVVREVTQGILEKLSLSRQMESQLLAIAINAASAGPLNQSGIVIAGFGTRDLYPRCKNFDVAAVFAGKTIKRDGHEQAITHEMGAAIIPFAQSDDVNTFMEGIGPVLGQFLRKTFYEILTTGLPDCLQDEICSKLNLSDKQGSELRKIADEMCKGACDYAFNQLEEQKRSNYIDPVLRATEFLSKTELAAMAETLVNLVSFRKQVTMEAETVGGPIDVAVITKGDGLVWTKRKHYFPPELNHHFFSNYYRKVGIHGQEE